MTVPLIWNNQSIKWSTNKEYICVISTVIGQPVCVAYKYRENLRLKSSSVTAKQAKYKEEGYAVYQGEVSNKNRLELLSVILE